MANDDSVDERAPLISAESAGSGGNIIPNGSGHTIVTVPPSSQDPPPYSPNDQNGGTPVISCRVCQAMINVEGKLHQHVVKCGACNEATPIRNAPPGKKYVRCPCNCLLICKASSMRIACPRVNCKRIINLAPIGGIPSESNGQSNTTDCRVTCGHCFQTFIFDPQTQALARCPHCRKISSVGPGLARKRAWIFLLIGFACLITGVGLTVGLFDKAKSQNAYYFLWAVAYVLALGNLIRGIHYARMKISTVNSPPNSNSV